MTFIEVIWGHLSSPITHDWKELEQDLIVCVSPRRIDWHVTRPFWVITWPRAGVKRWPDLSNSSCKCFDASWREERYCTRAMWRKKLLVLKIADLTFLDLYRLISWQKINADDALSGRRVIRRLFPGSLTHNSFWANDPFPEHRGILLKLRFDDL